LQKRQKNGKDVLGKNNSSIIYIMVNKTKAEYIGYDIIPYIFTNKTDFKDFRVDGVSGDIKASIDKFDKQSVKTRTKIANALSKRAMEILRNGPNASGILCPKVGNSERYPTFSRGLLDSGSVLNFWKKIWEYTNNGVCGKSTGEIDFKSVDKYWKKDEGTAEEVNYLSPTKSWDDAEYRNKLLEAVMGNSDKTWDVPAGEFGTGSIRAKAAKEEAAAEGVAAEGVAVAVEGVAEEGVSKSQINPTGMGSIRLPTIKGFHPPGHEGYAGLGPQSQRDAAAFAAAEAAKNKAAAAGGGRRRRRRKSRKKKRKSTKKRRKSRKKKSKRKRKSKKRRRRNRTRRR
jgi:hypothetical protein